MSEVEDIELSLLIDALLRRYKYDFRQYSLSSLKRRLVHAQQKFHEPSMTHLTARVLHEPGFLDELLTFMTVPTTEFFRDPSYFKMIREEVVPYLRTFPSLNVWIAGCSTGEELFSFAILFAEENLLARTTFFATDINNKSLESAKRGIFDWDVVKKGEENYLQAGGKKSFSDYYTQSLGAMEFHRDLIRNVVFSDHSLATDQVFTSTHLVSCRNVLIYFERPLQDRVFGLFRESLVRGGYLGLGSKETLRFAADASAFNPISETEKIYQKK